MKGGEADGEDVILVQVLITIVIDWRFVTAVVALLLLK